MKTKRAIPGQAQPIVKPIIVHDLPIILYSLGTGLARKEAKKRIIGYMKEVQCERKRLFGE